eukprot:g10743.t1
MNMVNSRVSLPALFVTTVVSLGVSLLHLSLFAPLLSAGRVEAANLVRLVATLATMLWWPVSNVVTKIWFVLLWPDRPLRARTVWDATKAGFVVQFHGFLTIGVAVFLANVVVQSAVEAMRKWESTVLQTAGECLTIGIYFNLWLPFTEKMWGFVWHPMILPSKADFKILRTSQTSRSPDEKAEHTTTSSAPPIPAPDEEEEDLFAKAGNVENTLRTRRQIILYASQVFFDLLRFVFGRGVLLQLSPAALILILLKDSTYHWWHFGFRQLEAALLFTVQISHPHPLTRGLITPTRWRLLSRITFQLQRISSVSRHLAVAFDEVIDYPTLARTLRARTKTVTEGELHLLRSFIRFYRQENFVRYQIRSHTRVFVSCLMIFVPLLSATGNVYYFAGYPQEESLAQMLALPLLFFAKDVLEWWLITFKFMMLYNEEQVARITPALLQRHLCGFELSKAWLRGSAAGQVLFAGIFGYSCYFGVLLYVLRWNPYNLAKIRDLTGLGEELEWAHIFQFCGLGEGQG